MKIKKAFLSLWALVLFLLGSQKAFAEADTSWVGTIEGPKQLKIGGDIVSPENPGDVLSKLVSSLLDIAFGIAILLVLGNIIFGAYQWITSGGKSDKIAAGRSRIIWAIIGLLLVSAAWGITVVVQGMLTGNFSTLEILPT